ncbi:hydroxyacid dehydrogenase [Bradyrhizobium sp. CCGUVB1N3]|uniref:hydroxyacid dehydrogenase n=1 Tax=Bradyrhizobium sp. CCGUVB1N3 TaxID=2949629 RepID=UPI0020B3103D|nr:hydroxyacid dehydrogenase [Bradyrhizobium sp. CCGUVB1N3]MCP3473312.1 hydroxyacid dehydrogenase [Bradyrhizobium sp. CCGUVB1N3]
MATNIARLSFFERWLDPVAEQMLGDCSSIDLTKLSYSDPEDVNWTNLQRAHGYQASTRGDMHTPWFADASLIKRCPNLLAIFSSGAGFDVIDVSACTRAGIAVCNQAGSNFEAVAEHTLGFMLALSKRISVTDRQLRRSETVDRYGHIGREIRGKTVGLIGLGFVGKRVAELCRGLFGMTVLACDPYLDEAEITRHGARKVSLNELVALSDFVSVHCPRNDETFGMIGTAIFEVMKPSAYLICTARGGIVREDELAAALASNAIAGAALDVFLKEPPPVDHPLLAFDNLIVTPHIAGMTDEALREMAASAARQWIALFSGIVPPHLVNPEVWPAFCERFAAEFSFRPAPLLAGGA